MSKALAGDRFEFLGKLSYSYYLNHTVVLAVLDLLFFKIIKLPHSNAGEFAYILLCLTGTHLLSLFTYRHVELILQSASPRRSAVSRAEMAAA